jgi:hypothetical protein
MTRVTRLDSRSSATRREPDLPRDRRAHSPSGSSVGVCRQDLNEGRAIAALAFFEIVKR